MIGYRLTQRAHVYFAIRDYIAARGRPPTLREIQAIMGFASVSTAGYHVRSLQREGLIERDVGLARAIRVARTR